VHVEFKQPKTEAEFEGYHRLRFDRLRKQHGLPPGSERDHPAEPSSVHLIAKVDDQVVGAACWVVGMRQDSAAGTRHLYVRFRQLAVDEDFEDRGIGVVLAREVEKRARAIGAEEIIGNVRLERVPLMERLGYVVLGQGETLFGTVEHMSMSKRLE
jgi:GNAT superfamily N-acetyltransferase